MDVSVDLLISYAERIVLAIVFLVAGLYVIKWIAKLITGNMSKSKLDESLQSFLVSLIKVALQVLLIISVVSMLGVEMTAFIAVLAAASFAVGLALQGSLSNFAGGVLILLLKPFQTGDYIEAAGYAGTVKDIQVFYTMLDTPDNRKIVIPNGALSNNSVVNYSAYETRRIDFKLGVDYGNDINKVREVLQRIADEHPLIFDEPEPMIVVGEHGDHAVIIYYRVWCAATDYWPLYFELMEKVKVAFDNEGIIIPYPQMDVHMPSA